MAKQNNPVALLIENIKRDQALLEEKKDILEKAKEEKNEIASRMKEYRKDVSYMWKYMSEEQQKQIEELGLHQSQSSSGGRGTLNAISEIALDVIMNEPKNAMTNGNLYAGYVDRVPEGQVAETYTQFNIKIRQLFNSGRLSKKQSDPKKASRDDMIVLHLDDQSDK